MTDTENILLWIQNWFLSNCDEEWENSYGIKIDTLDNPGWVVCIDLIGTTLEDFVMETIIENSSENDWVNCSIEENQFKGCGGAFALIKILKIFKEIVEGHKKSY